MWIVKVFSKSHFLNWGGSKATSIRKKNPLTPCDDDINGIAINMNAMKVHVKNECWDCKQKNLTNKTQKITEEKKIIIIIKWKWKSGGVWARKKIL